MTDAKNINILSKKTEMPAFVIVVMMGLTALTGLFNQSILSFGIVICCVLLLCFDKLQLAFPFMLFYNSFYGLVFGISVFRIYTLLIVLSAVLTASNKAKLKIKYLLPILVYAIYIAIVMLPQGVSSALFLFIDVINCVIIISKLLSTETILKSFFKIYVIVAIISFISGTLAENSIGGEYDYSRFMATFEDPNYMGFFFTVAVFAVVTLKLFDKRIRVLIIVSLYVMMLTSLSITGILVNIALWSFYLVVMKKIRWWSVFVIALVVVVSINLYNYGISNPETPVLGDFSARIEEKLDSLESGDMGDVTTNRSDLAAEHFEIYTNLPFLNMLFGGIAVNTRYIDPAVGVAGHNEYIDMLLNIGVVGTIVLLGYFVYNIVFYSKKYLANREDKYLLFIMAKVSWMLYAMTLTVFLDFRFMFLFLI